MVKKASGKWRMCKNYTDLNKACSKDSYPQPNIDRLVDRALGFTLLSFMDVYFGYNQIKMHPQDEAKTAFITNSGAFCNKDVIGTDVEVYVDDMVVRSTTASEHCSALERSTETAMPIFDTLKKGGNFAWTLEIEEAFL
ncbi:hypothetical protein CR513_42939, partial [Mucuna pruriens]